MAAMIAIVVGLVTFLLIFFAVPVLAPNRARTRTRNAINRIAAGGSETAAMAGVSDLGTNEDDEDVLTSDMSSLGKIFVSLPGGRAFYEAMLKAGYGLDTQKVLTVVLLLFTVVSAALFPAIGILSVLVGLLMAYLLPLWYFRRKIAKRNILFIEQFPEAIDMIVRSVKSGHPLNAAMRMIAENMEPPVAVEFKQVVNEVSYGRPLVEALQRMAKRIDEQDVNFFVVVLSVQQETGGNLAEILQNLSNVIRGRKRLSQKIRAMTSEGRATFWVLGALPFVQFGAVYIFSPEYLEVLFTTFAGNIVLAAAIGLIALAFFIISNLIKIDI